MTTGVPYGITASSQCSDPPVYSPMRVTGPSDWRQRVSTMNDASKTTMLASEDVLFAASRWRSEGRNVALATVVATWGSSPRPAGSQLAVDHEGNFIGSVSGGCIEGAVVREALEVMGERTPRLLDFGVSNEQAWEVGLACGGKVQVFVEALD